MPPGGTNRVRSGELTKFWADRPALGRKYVGFLSKCCVAATLPATNYPSQKKREIFLESWRNHLDIVHCVIAVSPRYAAPIGRFLPELKAVPRDGLFFVNRHPLPTLPISSRS